MYMNLYTKKNNILINLKNIKIKKKGEENTKSFFYYFYHNKIKISPWHDIPLYSKKKNIYNFICEIPKWTRKKFEINTNKKYNPIKQDIKNNKLREYSWGDVYFNYGCFPQTWEDPNHKSKKINIPGDNDPLDAIEIGVKSLSIGSITPVKIIAGIPLIDDDEIDWKIITIATDDPLSKKIYNINSLNKTLPGFLDAIVNWFKLYKKPDTNKENKFALNNKIIDQKDAIKVIESTHKLWENLFLQK